MAHRPALSGRSPVEWGTRLLLAVGAAYLGYASLTQSLASMLRNRAPERAHVLAPSDGRIVGNLSAELSGPSAAASDRVRSDDLARTALRLDPTAIAAVATLGLNAQIGGDAAAARRTFAYAQKLSRRDLRTQLWSIEDAVARNDVAGALRQYDIALRTSRGAPDLLFPVLASAISETSIRSGLEAMLKKRPPWGNDFLIYAAAASSSPQDVTALLLALQRAGVEVPGSAAARSVDALLARGDAERAWSYYASFRKNADRRTSRNPRFAFEYAAPTQFDWNAVNDGGIVASITVDQRGGSLDFFVPAAGNGPIARQVQMLPPGEYVLEGKMTFPDRPADALPYWIISCQDGRELARIMMLTSGAANIIFKEGIRIAKACPVQILSLVARPSNRMAGLVGQITEVRLRPVSSR